MLEQINLPILLIIGIALVFSLFMGKIITKVKLPTIIGYMVIGVILGPSALNILSDSIQGSLSFITEIALGFIALGVGLELSFSSMKSLGKSIIFIILLESSGAFLLTSVVFYLFTKNIPLSLLIGSAAAASDPAGTVAIIKEFNTKGKLTKALYAVVGFDDGIGIIIFGFASAIARSMLSQSGSLNILEMILHPMEEIFLSILIGSILAVIFSLILSKLKKEVDHFVIVVSIVMIVSGISDLLHLSIILTNMVVGIIIVNTQHNLTVKKIHKRMPMMMHLLFILFFTLAGASLHINAIPSLGLLGVLYLVSRSLGKIFGAKLGGIVGKSDESLKKYLGYGILSQAGVAIGLGLIVKHEFQGLGKVIETVNGVPITQGDHIGKVMLTMITVTSIIFTMIGPILTKYSLKKGGEIK